MRFSILITDDGGTDHMFDSEIDSISASRVVEAIDGCKGLLIPGEMLAKLAEAILSIVDMVDVKTYKIDRQPAEPCPAVGAG
jgi:hypothetical protein